MLQVLLPAGPAAHGRLRGLDALTSLPGLNASGPAGRCRRHPRTLPLRLRARGHHRRARVVLVAGSGRAGHRCPRRVWRGGGHPPAAAGGRAGVNAPPAKRRGMAAPERDKARDLAGPGPWPHPLQPRRPRCRRGGPRCGISALGAGPVRRAAAPRSAPAGAPEQWAVGKLDGMGNAEHRQLLERFLRWRLLSHLRSGSTTATPLGHGPYRGRASASPTAALSWHGCRTANGNSVNAPSTISTSGSPPGPPAGGTSSPSCPGPASSALSATSSVPVIQHPKGRRPLLRDLTPGFAAIRRLLFDPDPGTRRPHRRLPCSRSTASRSAGSPHCAGGRPPAPQTPPGSSSAQTGSTCPSPLPHCCGDIFATRSNMTTAANPASSWLFPGQLAGEHRSYRRLVRVLHQLGIPARAAPAGHVERRELVREAPRRSRPDALRRAPGHSYAPRVLRRRRLVRRPGEGRRWRQWMCGCSASSRRRTGVWRSLSAAPRSGPCWLYWRCIAASRSVPTG